MNRFLQTSNIFNIVILLFVGSAAAFGQTLNVTPLPETGDLPPSIGAYVNTGELPPPQWQNVNGTSVARLQINGADAAAWRLSFGSLALGTGSKMFLYGLDRNGQTVAVHGPYEGSGPLNIPFFESEVIQGSTLVVEIAGATGAPSEWPFLFSAVEQISQPRLAELTSGGLKLSSRFEPRKAAQPKNEKRTAWIDDELVPFEIVSGKAVVGGDVVLGTVDEVTFASGRSKSDRRESHAITSGTGYWASGLMPYTIDYNSAVPIMPGTQLDLNIKAAIKHWNDQFPPAILVPRTNQADYVTFKIADIEGFCASAAGRVGGQQFIEVPFSGCSTRALIHEIGHALGLKHEHQRPDRDNFVTINWNNILSDKTDQFAKPAAGTTAAMGSYDFGSIMHYSLSAFTNNGMNTISPKVSMGGITPGTTNVISAGDKAAVTKLYCERPANWGMPTEYWMDAEGGSGSFAFSGPKYCAYNITSNKAWITITGIKTGMGGGIASFTVTPNTLNWPRSGSVSTGVRATVIKQETNSLWGKE